MIQLPSFYDPDRPRWDLSPEPRPDFEFEGARARQDGQSIDANPWPARTWPWIEWRRGWERSQERKAA